ncbi:MAG: methionyl-tRNA formyltransferase [Acutalibacteraceae bacterium]|nr:methionyl-tRNA formyltransferase [Acutalibacteraceae bacterium]
MAQIDISKIEKLNKDRNSIHEKVYTTYSSFDSCGKHYVQIDTYGRSDREQPGKISQSIQLNKEAALLLIDLLKTEFNI